MKIINNCGKKSNEENFLQFAAKNITCFYITYEKNMASREPVNIDHDEIDFEDEYDKADPIDDVNLDESITALNESI